MDEVEDEGGHVVVCLAWWYGEWDLGSFWISRAPTKRQERDNMWHDDLGGWGREREMFTGGKESCLYMILPTRVVYT
jgi:hypothetical protein